MIKLPQQQWSQQNNSDKFGSLAYTKNINLDEEGYIKLSPRTIKLMDADISGSFGLPMAVGKSGVGGFQVASASTSNYTATFTSQQNQWVADTGTAEPTLGFDSDGIWFNGLWVASSATAVLSKASPTSSATWTSRVSGLTSGYNHALCVFQDRNSLCVANGNVVQQVSAAWADDDAAYPDLTLPSDFEVVGMAFNNARMGVITRLNNDGTTGQDQEAKFFLWDGATTGANVGVGVGSDAIVGITSYKSSFVILNRAGELLYWNGGGFDKVAAFPFYFSSDMYNDPFANNNLGKVYMEVDGDIILINIGMELEAINAKEENRRENTMSGVWCFDPKVGLYHRYSPSMSQGYVNYVAGADCNASTNTLVASAGAYGLQTIPATGNKARLTSGAIGGLKKNTDYYIIRISTTNFQLAETKEQALAGVAIDLTSFDANNYFWMYNILDFGNTYYESPGATSLIRERNNTYGDILLGARLYDTALSSTDMICVAVPNLENRGYFVTPKGFSGQTTDTTQKLLVKYRPLKDEDAIVVKYRTKDVLGLPVTSSGNQATWTSPTEFYTSQDLSEAKTYIDAGGELEFEAIAGAGAGQTVQVVSIAESSGTYAVVLEEDVIGASAGLKSEYIITNWNVGRTITSADGDYNEVPIGKTGKFVQFKVELRGSDVAVEELQIINSTHSVSA